MLDDALAFDREFGSPHLEAVFTGEDQMDRLAIGADPFAGNALAFAPTARRAGMTLF